MQTAEGAHDISAKRARRQSIQEGHPVDLSSPKHAGTRDYRVPPLTRASGRGSNLGTCSSGAWPVEGRPYREPRGKRVCTRGSESSRQRRCGPVPYLDVLLRFDVLRGHRQCHLRRAHVSSRPSRPAMPLYHAPCTRCTRLSASHPSSACLYPRPRMRKRVHRIFCCRNNGRIANVGCNAACVCDAPMEQASRTQSKPPKICICRSASATAPTWAKARRWSHQAWPSRAAGERQVGRGRGSCVTK
jgi:hypothetical protein